MKHYHARMRYLARAYGRGRVYAKLDIQAAQDRAQTLAKTIREKREQLAEKAMQDGYKPEDGKALYEEIERDALIYRQLTEALDSQMEADRARVSAAFNRRLEQTGARNREALGGLFRAMLTGAAPGREILDALSLPTTVTSGTASGGYLLPKAVSDQLIRDIVEDDGILSEITTTSITGLEMPRVSTADVDGDDVADGTSAPDATVTAGSIAFGRYPYAKCVTVPNSLLADTNTAIESYISTRHQEMMRARLCKRLFDTAAAGNYAHMSVYDATVVRIETVSATALLDGIMDALADLPTRPEGTYKVALKHSDWLGLIRTLANGAVALFNNPTREILGFEPVICNYVSKPLVGNLKTIHLNYDSAITYESERHAKERTTDFVLSTAYDIQIEQPALLRIVNVQAASGGGTQGGGTDDDGGA